MAKFYALGVQKFTEYVKGVKSQGTRDVIIHLDSYTRLAAENEAKDIARSNGTKLDLQVVYMVQGSNKQGSPLTKNAKARKLERGVIAKKNRDKKRMLQVK